MRVAQDVVLVGGSMGLSAFNRVDPQPFRSAERRVPLGWLGGSVPNQGAENSVSPIQPVAILLVVMGASVRVQPHVSISGVTLSSVT